MDDRISREQLTFGGEVLEEVLDMGTRSNWVVGRKKSENSFREDWIDQRERERERGWVARMSWY